MPKEISPLKEFKGERFTSEDTRRMMKAAPYLRDRLLIRFLWRTGARISEIIAIETEDIGWNKGVIIIKALKKRRKIDEQAEVKRDSVDWQQGAVTFADMKKFLKANSRVEEVPVKRLVPVDQGTLRLAREYLDKREGVSSLYLFDGDHNGHLSRQGAYYIIRKAAETVGLTGVHPHTFRHLLALFAIEKLGGGYDVLRKTQKILGHASIETTAGYLDYSPKEIRSMYSELFPDDEEEPEEEE